MTVVRDVEARINAIVNALGNTCLSNPEHPLHCHGTFQIQECIEAILSDTVEYQGFEFQIQNWDASWYDAITEWICLADLLREE
jgi:hypothetical protein